MCVRSRTALKGLRRRVGEVGAWTASKLGTTVMSSRRTATAHTAAAGVAFPALVSLALFAAVAITFFRFG